MPAECSLSTWSVRLTVVVSITRIIFITVWLVSAESEPEGLGVPSSRVWVLGRVFRDALDLLSWQCPTQRGCCSARIGVYEVKSVGSKTCVARLAAELSWWHQGPQTLKSSGSHPRPPPTNPTNHFLSPLPDQSPSPAYFASWGFFRFHPLLTHCPISVCHHLLSQLPRYLPDWSFWIFQSCHLQTHP